MSKAKQGWIVKNLRVFAIQKGEVWPMGSHSKPLKRAPKQSAANAKAGRDRSDYWSDPDVKARERERKRRERAERVLADPTKTVHGKARKHAYAPRTRK
jgi:hypothetical protein